MYGFVITEKGLELDAKLRAGEQLKLTRVMVGDGTVPDETNPRKLSDLISPFAEATSTAPMAAGASTKMTVEYRNDMNGGLDRDRYINEYGLFAEDPDDGEILYLYGNLGEFREPMRAYRANEPVITRRYPISITVTDGVDVALGYLPSVFVTEAEAEGLIQMHDTDPSAHQGLGHTLTGHISDRNNPHNVTAEQIGISDETAKTLGLDPANDPTVNDAFRKIASSVFPSVFATVRVFSPAGSVITVVGPNTNKVIFSSGEDDISVYEAGVYSFVRNKNDKIATREVEITEGGSVIPVVLSWRYGYRKKKAESDPYARIEYLYDAVGMAPARMDYSAGRFNIGDWGDAWFVRKNRPVMQKSDLTEDYELDHNDHTKKLDGSPSDVSNTGYDGNAMSAIPLCWWLRYDEDGYEYYIVCDHQWDESYKACAHTRADGSIEDYFYWGMFGGSGSKAKIRSLKGQSLAQNLTTQDQIDGAAANGLGWYIHSWSRRECIKDLLVLMAKSTDTQTAYGKGNFQNASGETGLLQTGTLCDKGQFWGSNANNKQVKVFYIEGFWGDQWLRTAGIINNSGSIYYKMTPEDMGYRIDDVEGYTNSGITLTGTSGGYISATKCGDFGCIPANIAGSDGTYECDGAWWGIDTKFGYLIAGSGTSYTYGVGGSFAFAVHHEPSHASWLVGCGLSSDMPGEEDEL